MPRTLARLGGVLLLSASLSATIFSSITGLIHDPQHRPVQGQPRLLGHRLNDQANGPVPQLIRILPRCWHDTTLPWLQTSHQTAGGSQ